ncbi:winged helix-turn-helix domain-containing protein [Bradyrhizobium sp. Pa8]|uniref:winged helix-turn-helix domain-containing protein n=1 Tax=Bradyrhizobium sp. Pa8 TaxID=3386552 RepID=UPI00403F22F7
MLIAISRSDHPRGDLARADRRRLTPSSHFPHQRLIFCVAPYCYIPSCHALDTDRREFRRGPDALPVAPQVFDLLAHLIPHRERVVSKDELINAIWYGRAVSDAALTTV